MKFNEENMAALISEVETHFADNLAKAEAEKGKSLKKSEEITEEVQAEEIQAAAKEEVIQKSEETEMNEQDFDYDEEDIAEMDKMYGSMTKSEVKAHLESIQKAHGVESEEVIAKSEEIQVESTKDDESELLKSEVSELKTKNEELKKSFDNLTTALTSFVTKGGTAPKQKAITRIEYIAKSEDEVVIDEKKEEVSKLSKSEISTRLTQKIREGALEKSDREKINQYYLDTTNLETIKHLL
jgi:hypothetical protein